jgi:hypothetical protein
MRLSYLEGMRNGLLVSATIVFRPAGGPVNKMVSIINHDVTENTEYCVVDVLPMATEMAGVNMRLEVGAVRYVRRGTAFISKLTSTQRVTLAQDGRGLLMLSYK